MIISHMPALILTDKEMPLLDGVQLIRTLREADRPIKIPVIAMLNANSEMVNNEFEKLEIKAIADDPAELDNISEELFAILN
jgi:CheY-like chemotaxis protein